MSNEMEDFVNRALDAMKFAIEQEDHSEFFVLFGDIYCRLEQVFLYAIKEDDDELINDIYNLKFGHLIPDSIDLAKEIGD